MDRLLLPLEKSTKRLLFKIDKHSAGRIVFHLKQMEMRMLSRIGKATSERVVEYPWVLQNLDLKEGSILDAGCCYSLLCHELIARGLDVYGIDVNPYPERHPNLRFYQVDVRNIPFQNEYFDRVLAVSTIEHIGLGAYNDPIYNNGDFIAMMELTRVLKKGGKMLITLPFGAKYMLVRHQSTRERIYDERRLRQLLIGKMLLEKEDYYVRQGKGRWVEASKECAKRVRSSHEVDIDAIACLLLCKAN